MPSQHPGSMFKGEYAYSDMLQVSSSLGVDKHELWSFLNEGFYSDSMFRLLSRLRGVPDDMCAHMISLFYSDRNFLESKKQDIDQIEHKIHELCLLRKKMLEDAQHEDSGGRSITFLVDDYLEEPSIISKYSDWHSMVRVVDGESQYMAGGTRRCIPLDPKSYTWNDDDAPEYIGAEGEDE